MRTRDLPSIAIVTPCFNQAEYLEQTILSVISQGYPRLQYVVMDGGSTDGSVDVIRKYAHALHDWASEPDEGQYDAIQKGFDRTDADVMGWINSDDLHLPWTLRTVGTTLADLDEIEWLTSFYPGFCDCTTRSVTFHKATGYSRQSILDGRHCPNDERFIGYIAQECTFWRRSLWDRVGGLAARTVDLAADFDLWARFAEHAHIHASRSALGVFRHQPAQRSTDVEAYTRESHQALAAVNERLGRRAPQLTAEAGAGRFAGFFKKTPGHDATEVTEGLREYQGFATALADLEDPDAPWAVRPYSFS